MIYVKHAKESKSVRELLVEGFTYHQFDVYKFQPTYFDGAFTKQQCHAARRSFGDIVEIVQTRFPKATKEQIAYVLLNQVPYMFSFHCGKTGLLVFMVDTNEFIKFRETIFKKDVKGTSYSYIKGLSNKYEKNRSSRKNRKRKSNSKL